MSFEPEQTNGIIPAHQAPTREVHQKVYVLLEMPVYGGPDVAGKAIAAVERSIQVQYGDNITVTRVRPDHDGTFYLPA